MLFNSANFHNFDLLLPSSQYIIPACLTEGQTLEVCLFDYFNIKCKYRSLPLIVMCSRNVPATEREDGTAEK